MTTITEANFECLPGVFIKVPVEQDKYKTHGLIGIRVKNKQFHLKFILTQKNKRRINELTLAVTIGYVLNKACGIGNMNFKINYIRLSEDIGYSGIRWPYFDFIAKFIIKEPIKKFFFIA